MKDHNNKKRRSTSSSNLARLICVVAIVLAVFQLCLNFFLMPRTIIINNGDLRPPLPSSSKAASLISNRVVAANFDGIEPKNYPDVPRGRFLGKFFNGKDISGKMKASDPTKWDDVDTAYVGEYKRVHFVPSKKKSKTKAAREEKLARVAKLLRKSSSKYAGNLDTNNDFPPKPVNLNEFYASFEGIFKTKAGQYRLLTSTTSAVRVFLDGQLVFDDWRPRTSPISRHHLVRLSAGHHLIRVEFNHFSTVNVFSYLKQFQGGAQAVKDAKKKHWEKKASLLEIPSLALKWTKDDFGLKIYVYDLPKSYNEEILEQNPKCKSHMFAPEVYIHQKLMESSVKTNDPREADLFYVPTYTSCKYLGRGMFGVDPWFGKRLVRSSIDLISRKFPYWNRHKGQDHIFSMTYDYGACFEYKYEKANQAGVLRELHASILLSIISDTTNSCFRPSIDVVVPAMVSNPDMLGNIPKKFLSEEGPSNSDDDDDDENGNNNKKSDGEDNSDDDDDDNDNLFEENDSDDLKSKKLSVNSNKNIHNKREIFCYFQGSTEWGVDHDPDYSRGVRRAIKEHHGDDPLFVIGEGKTNEYVKKMSNSLFCLAPLGFAVWSPRIYESVINGCIPVIIGNGIRLPFDWEMDWRDFSVKIPEWRIKKGQLRQILASIPHDRITMKQQALAKVRASVAYIGNGDPTSQTAFGYLMRELRAKAHTPHLISHPSDNDFWT